MYFKIALSLCVIVSFSQIAYPFLGQERYSRKAKKYLERAEELEASDDPHAEHYYKSAIKANGGVFPEALEKLCLHLQSQLRFSEAAEFLKQYIDQTPGEDHTDDLSELEELKRAARLQKIINSSEQPKLQDLLDFASIADGYGKAVDALPYAKKAVDLYPMSSKAHLVLARLLSFGPKEKMLAHLEKAVELDPKNAEAHSAFGWYYFLSKGTLEQAVESFNLALTLSNGQEASAWQGLGRVLAIQGKKKEAIEAYRHYLETRKVPSQYDEEIKRQIRKLERTP